MGTTDTLYARVNSDGVAQDVSLGSLPAGFHFYRVQPVAGGFDFYVDGLLRTELAASVPPDTLKLSAISDFQGATSLQADWVRYGGYAAAGTFTSSLFDAGGVTSWGSARWTADMPAGTSVLLETSSGNSANPDDGTWSDWTAVDNGGAVASPPARYLRYRVTLTSADPGVTPVVYDVSFG
jgi:hypothetical protein